jgi:DNA invertase Pin-like site-specific DNA recombinase
MRAAIHARVSTERQERQQTIDSQLASLRRWAEAEGHALAETHVFRDEGYSGSRLDRPGLDSLRDAASDAAIEIVAVLSPDRLARRYAYQVLLLEEFRRAGVGVAFSTIPSPRTRATSCCCRSRVPSPSTSGRCSPSAFAAASSRRPATGTS